MEISSLMSEPSRGLSKVVPPTAAGFTVESLRKHGVYTFLTPRNRTALLYLFSVDPAISRLKVP